MKQLIVWGYPIKDIDRMEQQKIPMSDQIGICEVFNPKKTQPKFNYAWVSTIINENIVPMPEQVFVCVKTIKKIHFDFYPFKWDFFLVSAKLLAYIEKQGINYVFEKSVAIIVNTKGEKLTEETFYFLRIISWKICEEIIYPDLNGRTDGFSLAAYANSENNVYLTGNNHYIGTLIFNTELKDEIVANFRNPFLYTLEEWKKLS